MAFTDPRNGYGVIDGGIGTACATSVGRTDDGGSHFTRLVEVDHWACGGGRPAAALAFDDHGDGFLYGPSLYTTHDAGRTWTQTPTPEPVVAVAALGYSVWMVEADCPDPGGAGGCKVALFTSSDGGRNWAPTANLQSAEAGGNTGMSPGATQGPAWLVRTSLTAAYVLTPPRLSLSGASSSAPIWHTSDSGRTWTSSDIPCAIPAMGVVADAGPDGKLWAVCSAQAEAGYQPKTVETSTDGGRSWQLKARCWPPGTPKEACQGTPPDFGYLGGIDPVSDTTAFLVGARSALMVTHDGGATWQPVAGVTAGTDGGTQQVIFFDANNGVVLGDDSAAGVAPALWSTTDGGTRWQVTMPSIPQ